MNELVEKLKKQSTIRVNNPIVNSDGKVICDDWEEVISISKFAELIVRECFAKLTPYLDDQFIDDIELELKEHFGVE